MAVNRRAAKRDGNEGEIIEALRAAGATVEQLSKKGVVDLLCGYMGWNILIEVKMPKAHLTEDQEAWHGSWNGTTWVAHNTDEALKILEYYAEQEVYHHLDFASLS